MYKFIDVLDFAEKVVSLSREEKMFLLILILVGVIW
jgi:hypothetical protein